MISITNIEQIIYSSLIVLISSTIQGTVGFGFALIAVPLLSLFLPLTIVVPIIVICSTITNIMVVITTKEYIRLKQIWTLILFGIIGIPIGVYALKNLDSNILKLSIGLIVVITVFAMFRGIKIKFKNKTFSYSIAGFTSGVLNGSISMSGPPIVLFLTNEGYEKDSFRANLTAYAVITNTIAIVTYYFSGMLNIEVIKVTGINIAALLIGSSIGIVIAKKFKEKTFNKITLIMLLIAGLTTVVKAIGAI